MSETNHTPEPCGYCKQVDHHSRGCCLSPDICDRLIDRQNHGRDDLSNGVLHDLGLMREAAAAIERLRAENADLKAFIFEIAEPPSEDEDGKPIPEGERLSDAKSVLRSERASWMEACNAIRAGKDFRPGVWPSMVERWRVAAIEKIGAENQRLRAVEVAAREAFRIMDDDLARPNQTRDSAISAANQAYEVLEAALKEPANG